MLLYIRNQNVILPGRFLKKWFLITFLKFSTKNEYGPWFRIVIWQKRRRNDQDEKRFEIKSPLSYPV